MTDTDRAEERSRRVPADLYYGVGIVRMAMEQGLDRSPKGCQGFAIDVGGVPLWLTAEAIWSVVREIHERTGLLAPPAETPVPVTEAEYESIMAWSGDSANREERGDE